MFNPDESVRRRINEKIKAVFADKISPLLNDYRALYANFMVKEPGQ